MAKLSPEEVGISYDQRKSLISMSGGNGSKVYGVGTYTGNFVAISVREDSTTFGSIVAKGSGTDKSLSDFYLGGATPLAGDLITPDDGYRITSFEVTAGSVQAH